MLTPNPATRNRRSSRRLLASCAVGLALVAVARAPQAQAQTQPPAFQGTPTTVGGTAVVTRGGPSGMYSAVDTVNVSTPTAVIDWVPFDAATGTTPIDFLPSGTAGIFRGNGDYTVLNRILAADPSRAIGLNGFVGSLINDPVGIGGNIWFYAPGGIVVGSGAVFNVGSLVLSADAIDTTDGLYGPGGSIRFRGTPNSQSAVMIQSGAQIALGNAGSYLAVVAPRVVNAGTVAVNGSTAYVAAEQVDVTINQGLFDINVLTGTSVANAIEHSGTTTAPAPASEGVDNQRVFLVAVPKNNAITMLVGGTLGSAATGVSVDNGTIVLSAGYDVAAGAIATTPENATQANIRIQDGEYLSNVVAHASGTLLASPIRPLGVEGEPAIAGDLFFRGSATLEGDVGATVGADLDEGVSVAGGLTIRSKGGSATLFSDNTTTEFGYGTASGSVAITGNLRIDSSAVGINNPAAGGTGGIGQGGISTLLVEGGIVTVSGTTDILADGSGGSGLGTQGQGRGGTATIEARALSDVNLQAVRLSASGTASAAAVVPAPANGGAGTGGTAQILLSGGTLDAITIDILATGTGSTGDVAATGSNGGTGQGGTTRITGSGGVLNTGNIALDSRAYGGAAGAAGQAGAAHGGTADVSFTAGTADVGTLGLDISAVGGTAGAGGVDGAADAPGGIQIGAAGIGTEINVTGALTATAVASSLGGGASGGAVKGGTITIDAADGGLLSATSEIRADAGATSQQASFSVLPAANGPAEGGTIDIGVTGGTISAPYLTLYNVGSSGPVTGLSGTAKGGAVNLSASDAAGLDGSIDIGLSTIISADGVSGAGASTSAATGGDLHVFAEGNGALNLGSVSISTNGYAGEASSGAGTSTGGTITFETLSTDASITATSLSLFSTGAASFGGSNGNGAGGTITINVDAGSFTADSLFAYSQGYGSSAPPTTDPAPIGAGGTGTGGTVAFNLRGGTADIGEIGLYSSGSGRQSSNAGSGQSAATGGAGIGGDVTLFASGGTLNVESLSLVSEGIGGEGGYSSSGTASGGGAGTGGTASLDLDGGTIGGSTLFVSARGYGGAGGEGFGSRPAGSGGLGQGGVAGIDLGGGAFDFVDVSVSAEGSGGLGGVNSDTGNAGAGGFGIGGQALFSSSVQFDVASLTVNANGAGGDGGVAGNFQFESGYGLYFVAGPGAGGGGGGGRNGDARVIIDFDPTIANLVISADSIGGDGGDGTIGGSGGDGVSQADVTGNGAVLQLIDAAMNVENATITSRGIGGQGGQGGAQSSTGGSYAGAGGTGGSGGAGEAGYAAILIDGPDAVLTLSPDYETQTSLISANAAGGGGGISYASPDTEAPGTSGAAGGSAIGGPASIEITNGGRLVAGPQILIGADAIGGDGTDATSGSTGGIGGEGGQAAGGMALLSIDGGTLEAADPDHPLDWSLSASAVGGFGAAGGNGSNVGDTGGRGGNGGQASGGIARITMNDATYQLGDVALYANGVGGGASFGGIGAGLPGIPGDPGNPEATPPIPPTPPVPPVPQTFAQDGRGGDGTGGLAGFINGDSGGDVTPGERSVGALLLQADGTGGLLSDFFSGFPIAGRTELTDSATQVDGSVSFGDVTASSSGFAFSSDSGFFLQSSGGGIDVLGNLTVTSGGRADFEISGSGTLAVGGSLYVDVANDIAIRHLDRPTEGAEVPTIQAGYSQFNSGSDFLSEDSAIVDGGSELYIRSFGGSITAGELRAIDLVSARARGMVTIRNATADGPVTAGSDGIPLGGRIEFVAGLDPYATVGTFDLSNVLITGTVTASGAVLVQAGGDIVVQSGAMILSDNLVRFESGDDIIVEAGATVRAAIDPLPEFGYGTSGPATEPGRLSFDAGVLDTFGLPADNVAAIRIDGEIAALDRAVVLRGGAIQADAGPIDSKNFYATIVAAPAVGAPANGDGGQLRADCIAGNICLGSLGATNIVNLGPETGDAGLPNVIRVFGQIAANDVVIRARDALDFGGSEIPTSISGSDRLFVAAQNAGIALAPGSLLEGGNFRLYAGGAIDGAGATLRSSGDMALFSGGDFTIGTLDVGGALQTVGFDGTVLRPDAFEVAQSITIGDQLIVRGGGVSLAAGTGINVGAVQALDGGDIDFTSDGGLVRLGAAGGELGTPGQVNLVGGSIAVGTISASGGMQLHALDGDLTFTDLNAGGILLTSDTGDISGGDATAGGGVELYAAGTIDVGRLAASGGYIRANADRVAIDSAIAGFNGIITIDSGAGGTLLGEASAGIDINLFSEGDIVAGALTADDDIFVNAFGGISIDSAITTGLSSESGYGETDSSVRLESIGGITLGTVDAFDFALLYSDGALTSDTITAGNGIDIDIRGFATIGSTTTIAPPPRSSARFGRLAAAVEGGLISINADQGMAIEAIDSRSDVLLQADDGGIVVSQDLRAAGSVSAFARDIDLTAIGDLAITEAEATDGDLKALAGGTLTMVDGVSAGDIILTSTDVDVIVESARSGVNFEDGLRGSAIGPLAVGTPGAGDIVIDARRDAILNGSVDAASRLGIVAGGRAEFNAAATGEAIEIFSGDIAIGSGGSIGAAGTTRTLEITNGDSRRRTYIGGATTADGYSLSGEEMSRLVSDDITIQASRVASQQSGSVGSTRAPDVIVGAFTLTSRASGGAQGNLGAQGTLRIQTPGKLRVNGAVSLTGMGADNRFEIDAAEAFEVINGAGSIDLRGTGTALGGTLSLASSDVIVATAGAIADVAAATSATAIDTRLAQNDGITGDDGALRAGGIEVDVQGGFYVQNTGSTAPATGAAQYDSRRGLTVGSGGLRIRTEGTTSRIVINGRQINPTTGGFTTGLDFLKLVSINGQTPGTSGFDPLSTINGCVVVGTGACAFIPPPPPPPPAEPEPPIPSRDVIEEPVDGDLFVIDLPTTLVEFADFQSFGFEPLIDEPVTGAGNDDLWTEDCEPGPDGRCAPPANP